MRPESAGQLADRIASRGARPDPLSLGTRRAPTTRHGGEGAGVRHPVLSAVPQSEGRHRQRVLHRVRVRAVRARDEPTRRARDGGERAQWDDWGTAGRDRPVEEPRVVRVRRWGRRDGESAVEKGRHEG